MAPGYVSAGLPRPAGLWICIQFLFVNSAETRSDGAPLATLKLPGHPLRPQTFKKAPENVVTEGGPGSARCPGRKYQIEKHLSSTLVSSLLFRHWPDLGFWWLNICIAIRSLGGHGYFIPCFELKKKKKVIAGCNKLFVQMVQGIIFILEGRLHVQGHSNIQSEPESQVAAPVPIFLTSSVSCTTVQCLIRK